MRKASDANLDFDGMTGDGVNRDGSKYAGNHWGGVQNPNKTINEGVGPRKGNQDYRGIKGPSATKDAYRPAPRTSEASGREYPKNIDSINYGKQERNPGGTRPRTPEKGQNYKGNIDMIRIGQTGGPGYGEVSRSSNPERSSSTQDNFNYGPKKQY
jgi:hypothetical protein